MIDSEHPADADMILDYARKHTRTGQDFEGVKRGDRPWNDPGPLPWRKRSHADKVEERDEQTEKPILRAIVFDMSSCSNIDSTSVQVSHLRSQSQPPTAADCARPCRTWST